MDQSSHYHSQQTSRRSRRDSRSPDRRRRSGRDRSPSPYGHSRSGDRDHRRRGDSSHGYTRKSPSPPDRIHRRHRSPSPFTDESTRDARTVFVTQLSQSMTDQRLNDYLSVAGRVKSAKIVTDKLTGRSKGMAYVEFYTEQAAENALGLSGDKIDGFPISVQPSETNRITTIEQATSAVRRAKLPVQSQRLPTKVLVRNIHRSIREDSLRKVFAIFGRIATLHYLNDPDIHTQFIALVEYERPDDAQKAADDLNEFSLGGIPLMTYRVENQSELELLEESGGHVSNVYTLLQRLNAGNIMLPSTTIPLNGVMSSSSSSCIQLSNMYDPDAETGAHWEFEIADDIREECGKLGKILHLHVQKNKSGDVCVKFQDATAAQKAIDLFNGRWFGLRQVSCRHIPENLYNDIFIC